MPTLELALRIAASSQLGVLAVMLLLHGNSNRSYYYAATLAVGVAAYLLAPLAVLDKHWGVASYPILLLAIVVPALFWYFTSTLFSDDFTPPSWVKWLAMATALLGLAAFCTGSGAGEHCHANLLPVPDWMAQIAKLLWIAAALVTVLQDWQTDLVESRRRLRLIIVVGAACYMGIIIIIELLLEDRIPAAAELFNMSVLLIAVTALSIHLLDIRKTNVFARIAKPVDQFVVQASALAEQVVGLMEQDRAYAMDSLTIAKLADLLRTQPYLLREVINSELGYRNFNTFINLYRVKEVAHRLQQPEYRKTPLLTLALDAGFRSLAPFNRTFKDHYGTTPSEYRQKLESES
jgi:AraC-like DNA-binding protein